MTQDLGLVQATRGEGKGSWGRGYSEKGDMCESELREGGREHERKEENESERSITDHRHP